MNPASRARRYRAALLLLMATWPLVLASAVAARMNGHVETGAALVYLAASRVCHQRPDRSFQTAGFSWPELNTAAANSA